MRPTIVAISFLAVVSLVGCADNAELKKARAEAAEAKAELAKVKAELDQVKAKLAILEGKNNKSSADPGQITSTVREFFGFLHKTFRRSAYDSTSLAYQKRTDFKMFEQFLEKNPALLAGASNISKMENALCNVRKLAKDNAYECDLVTNGGFPTLQEFNITLRLIEQDGRWKIDDFVEVKSTPVFK